MVGCGSAVGPSALGLWWEKMGTKMKRIENMYILLEIYCLFYYIMLDLMIMFTLS